MDGCKTVRVGKEDREVVSGLLPVTDISALLGNGV